MSAPNSAEIDAGRALAERLTSEAMISQVQFAISEAQTHGHVEYKRRVGYAGRLTIAKTVLDAICEALEIPTSIDLLMDPQTRPTPPDLTDDGMGNTCSHTSATGVDTTSWTDPNKVWRCDHCGLRWVQGPDGTRVTPPGEAVPTECPMVTVKATQCPHDVCWKANTCQATTRPLPPEATAP